MRKSEIATYMDAYMEGFWQCYDMMMDMMDDEDEPIQTDMTVQELAQKVADADSARRKRGLVPELAQDETSQEEVESSQETVKEEPKAKPNPRTGTNVPEPRNVPHAPEKPTKTPMPEVKPTHDKFVELFKYGKLPTEVAKELNVSPQTAYNHLYKAKQAGELK